jgi:hypothetical protein
VLSSDIKMMLGSREKRVFHVLLPIALPPWGVLIYGKPDRGRKYEIDYHRYAPLMVLDGDKSVRLETLEKKFNIDRYDEGGILIQEGYILENSALFEFKVQIK